MALMKDKLVGLEWEPSLIIIKIIKCHLSAGTFLKAKEAHPEDVIIAMKLAIYQKTVPTKITNQEAQDLPEIEMREIILDLEKMEIIILIGMNKIVLMQHLINLQQETGEQITQ
jgi:hypothetical protein